MAIKDENRIYDGWVSLEKGVDAGRPPNALDPGQAVMAENMTFRGGHPRPRPGIRKQAEWFQDETLSYREDGTFADEDEWPIAGQQSFEVYKTGVFQCALGYSPHHGRDSIMAMIGGRLFRIYPGINSAEVVEIAPIKNESGPSRIKGLSTPIDPPTTGKLHAPIFNPATGGAGIDVTISCSDAGSHLFYTLGHDPATPTHTGDTATGTTIKIASNTGVVNSGADGNSFKVLAYQSGFTDSDIATSSLYSALPTRNRSNLPIAYMVQADKWLVIQDGESKPILYDSKEARRSNLEGLQDKLEVPVGTIMGSGMGRIVVTVNERDMAFGDLIGSHTGDDPADSLILFTERNFLTEGFDAAIPFHQGIATGMEFFPQLDTSTGTGELMVFAERGTSSFFLSLPREVWKTSQFQIQSLRTTGLRGHRSIAIVNEDLWFRADDGVRTYRQARSEQTGWAHIPLSTNVGKYLDADTKWLLKYASAIYFDNRIIMTCNPVWNQGRPYHNGLVVVDFDIVSSFGTKAQPAWEGHWKQIGISQLVTAQINGTTRAFMFGIDPDGFNQLYEISLDDKDDWDGQVIQWELEHRAYDFSKISQQGNPFTESDLYDGDLWVSGIAPGTITGAVIPPPPPGQRQPPNPRPPPPEPPPRP